MTTYGVIRLVHVLWAVLGSGLLLATALVSRRGNHARPEQLLVLSRWSSIGLLAMLGPGVAMNVIADGAFGKMRWFQLSGLSLIVTGAVVGLGRRRLRQWSEGAADAAKARSYVERSAWAACALVAWITVLMELRPFQ